MRRSYNVKLHPDYISGAKAEDELLAEYANAPLLVSKIATLCCCHNKPQHFAATTTNCNTLRMYLSRFEGGGGSKDGRVTLLEFEAYYDKACCELSDDHFQVRVGG